ncbi:hypothetical protein [Dyadobacter psychrophilus]|uniref:Uncharacterized protein n=1 Tax=Dyadobacter psychrophilus TaxID=651661 RepID=A0A1T5HFY8_9BACT|nr:hypothetical protein [Dyadobacter psychrophilus]SKC19597.1 hypothetical protein SAMN05660293_05493 [Dyadobacter psychrophilus]
MKAKSIRFFSPQENEQKVDKKAKAKSLPKGYISAAGKIVFPSLTIEELGIEPDTTRFLVGTDDGKRKIKNLYLVPTNQDGAFSITRSGRGYSLPLDLILSKGGIDYGSQKYVFTASIFQHEGSVGYALEISPEQASEKVPYTGKPRGRRPKDSQQTDDQPVE